MDVRVAYVDERRVDQIIADKHLPAGQSQVVWQARQVGNNDIEQASTAVRTALQTATLN